MVFERVAAVCQIRYDTRTKSWDDEGGLASLALVGESEVSG